MKARTARGKFRLWLRTFATLGLLAIVGATAACLPTGPSPATWTRSYYVANPDPAEITKLGCFNSDVSGRMTLFFGAPVDVNGTFGTTLWGGQDRNVWEIGELVKEFIRGFAWCRTGGQQILVGMGTSNSGADNKPDDWIAGHGHTWAAVVASVADWAAVTYPGIAQVYGAWDAEPGWSQFSKADLWMGGYNAFPGNRAVHANFSADGCPRSTSDDGPCNNGWWQYHVWHLAWEYDPSLPMPQIYANSGVNARQWQKLSEYGARHHNDRMVFYGVMTQHGACMQVGGCDGISNLPHEGHDQLLVHLSTTALTHQQSIETVTDMHWHY